MCFVDIIYLRISQGKKVLLNFLIKLSGRGFSKHEESCGKSGFSKRDESCGNRKIRSAIGSSNINTLSLTFLNQHIKFYIFGSAH
mmetsp:Transcript_15754/g.35455  ORF Transcript_15754/g.35455 Transcript_15754/m.35455 type:complete len:85 (-) Transcript_15754:59-313(-)